MASRYDEEAPRGGERLDSPLTASPAARYALPTIDFGHGAMAVEARWHRGTEQFFGYTKLQWLDALREWDTLSPETRVRRMLNLAASRGRIPSHWASPPTPAAFSYSLFGWHSPDFQALVDDAHVPFPPSSGEPVHVAVYGAGLTRSYTNLEITAGRTNAETFAAEHESLARLRRVERGLFGEKEGTVNEARELLRLLLPGEVPGHMDIFEHPNTSHDLDVPRFSFLNVGEAYEGLKPRQARLLVNYWGRLAAGRELASRNHGQGVFGPLRSETIELPEVAKTTVLPVDFFLHALPRDTLPNPQGYHLSVGLEHWYFYPDGFNILPLVRVVDRAAIGSVILSDVALSPRVAQDLFGLRKLLSVDNPFYGGVSSSVYQKTSHKLAVRLVAALDVNETG